MKYNHSYQPRKSAIALAVAATIGGITLPNTALSDIYVWGKMTADPALTTTCSASPEALPVLFTMLDSGGAALPNSSLSVKVNQYQTSTCGTLSYNTATQSGDMTIGAFDFFGNDASAPATAAGITIEKVPNGLDDGSGNLLLANMLFNWNGSNGIPVSVTMDAGTLLNEMDGTPTTFTLTDAGGGVITVTQSTSSPLDAGESTTVPASDGTYTGPAYGYLNTGPVPLATTEWNTTNVAGCTYASCMGFSPSADITASSAVADNVANPNEYLKGDGFGIGGNPMQDGAFIGSNANFDFTSMTLYSFTDTTPPVLTMNGAATINITQGDTYTELGATCIDAAPLNTVIPVTPGGQTVDTNIVATYTVTYDCKDNAVPNNAATQQSRTVNVAAAGTPQITLLGVTPVTHECAATAYSDAGATAVAGDGSTDISGSIIDDITVTNPDVNTVASYTLHYDVNDGFNNAVTVTRTVNVVDTTSPVVTLIGPSPENVASSTPLNIAVFTDQGATVVDSCDTSLASPIAKTSGSVATMVVPDTGPDTIPYSLTYAVTDADGNQGSASRTVNVVRSQPVVKLNGSKTIVVANVGDAYTEEGMDILDAQDGNVLGVIADGTAVSGLTYSISGTVDTNTAGTYVLTYSATDNDGNIATSVERTVKVGVFAVNSNFSMLDSAGAVFGGANDVVMSWDEVSFNANEADNNFGLVTIASAFPEPFFAAPWYAHHVRIFEGPATGSVTYSFNTGCTVADLEATGCPVGSGTPGATISMTINAGQIGAHMLFDWNGNLNIDVVNVWDQNAVWNDHGDAYPKNSLWLDEGKAGVSPAADLPWRLVSTDHNNNGINSSPMVDGPFINNYANFNFGPSGTGAGIPDITTTAPDTKLGGGALSWGMLLGMLPLMVWLRKRIK